MSVRAKLREIAEHSAIDPKKALFDALGDYSGIEVLHNLILIATYIRPEKTAGGVYLSDRSLKEDEFQGSAGMVLKCGPLAFQDDGVCKFGGVTLQEGDWVAVRPSDGLRLYKVDMKNKSLGVSCRLFEDTQIKARLSDPSLIY